MTEVKADALPSGRCALLVCLPWLWASMWQAAPAGARDFSRPFARSDVGYDLEIIY